MLQLLSYIIFGLLGFAEPNIDPIPVVTPDPVVIQMAVEDATFPPPPKYLTETQMRYVLLEAGWEPGIVFEEALRVSYGESVMWQPAILGDNGTSFGLFQIKGRVTGWHGWWEYFGFDVDRYADPVYNATLARLIFEYEQERGYERWSNWTVKP